MPGPGASSDAKPPPADTGIVALIGSGGRESAIAWKLAQSPAVQRILLVPGNGYTETRRMGKIENADFRSRLDTPANFDGFAEWCVAQGVSLVVVGPEAPLAVGLVDHLLGRDIKCFGPTKEAARLEWDKAYAKEFFDKHAIPTAKWKAFSDAKEAEAFIARYLDCVFTTKASDL